MHSLFWVCVKGTIVMIKRNIRALRLCVQACTFIVRIYRFSFLTHFFIIMAAKSVWGSDQNAWTCRLIFLSVARKFLLNKFAYNQDIEKQGTERTVKMCMLIGLIVVRKHNPTLNHCPDITLKRLQRCRLICVSYGMVHFIDCRLLYCVLL